MKKVIQKKNNTIPNDFWNYGINPILGYKYEQPHNKHFKGVYNELNNF
mgnify:CR=1 FL=1